ncbi:site-specific DNA-methyltransferase [Halobacteriovorax sp. JY17]|uniref:DNA-methyltransferase n=1 Tax=Halobacteriovorax sp. JY17 TaxID=2014617 RepID=UPI000C5D25A6|nr:site-specific DNA-methyltransferase [Halobacteriovorax sp. JY17]PIK15696.1 MAG: site-specific DNA-methyltransferase [Halobacteriovorax sp. JY17]
MTNFLEIEQHRHINGDSTIGSNYDKVMKGEKAKMLYADPPYCLLVRRNKKTGALRDPKTAKINHEAVTRYENVKSYKFFTEKWMGEAVKHISDDGILVIWTNYLGIKPIKDTALKLGFDHFYGEFLWGKLAKETNSGNETNVRLYEVALVFSKVPPKKLEQSDLPIQWSIITKYDEEGEASKWENHPNHKPYSCLEPLIRNFTLPGDRILDPFTGSGSTPAATIQLGRFISGIELRENWASISQKRIAELVKN